MSPVEPSAAPLLPPGSATNRWARLGAALRGTWLGRLLVAGVGLKLTAAAVRLVTSAGAALVGLVDALGSVALILAGCYVLYRFVSRARRRLLWRVRRKLILSYIF